MKPYIVCTGTPARCVVFGFSPVEPVVGGIITLHRARMILYWAGDSGLFGVAAKGPAAGSRITPTVESTSCTVVQSLVVSPASAAAFEALP